MEGTMSQHGRRAQKKLAKKKAKRAGKRAHVVRGEDAWVEAVLRSAGEWPIVEALVPDNLWAEGIGNLVIARRMPDGRLAVANFLVDTYCLGVKDAFCEVMSPVGYQVLLGEVNRVGRMKPVPPERFAKLVLDAVEYARQIGFFPHPDYNVARLLLAGIDASAWTETFEFGKDGKPFYVQGPNDSNAKAATIAARVKAAGGEYVLVLDDPAAFGLASADEFEPEDEDEAIEP
jgi:hypothetical protein